MRRGGERAFCGGVFVKGVALSPGKADFSTAPSIRFARSGSGRNDGVFFGFLFSPLDVGEGVLVGGALLPAFQNREGCGYPIVCAWVEFKSRFPLGMTNKKGKSKGECKANGNGRFLRCGMTNKRTGKNNDRKQVLRLGRRMTTKKTKRRSKRTYDGHSTGSLAL
jgi:hypothetical protein